METGENRNERNMKTEKVVYIEQSEKKKKRYPNTVFLTLKMQTETNGTWNGEKPEGIRAKKEQKKLKYYLYCRVEMEAILL